MKHFSLASLSLGLALKCVSRTCAMYLWFVTFCSNFPVFRHRAWKPCTPERKVVILIYEFPDIPPTYALPPIKDQTRFMHISLLLCLAKRLRKPLMTGRCWHYIRYCVYMALFHSHNNHLKYALLIQFYGSENRGQES